MACGAPVITSNTSSIPEVAGDAALLIDPHDAHHLAEAIIQVLSQPDLAEKLSAKGQIQAAKFSWQKTAQATAEVYRSLLSD